jgi:hypothetical protein
MKARGILLLCLLALGSGGCTSSQATVPEPQVLPLVSPEEIMPTQLPTPTIPLLSQTQGDNSQMTPISPGLPDLLEKAKEDLAEKLSIPVAEISILKATGVIWPDSSLGCPLKGMFYTQVLTPGYLILLEFADKKYEYHADKGTNVIYCTNPTAPVPGTPDNN